MSAHLLLYGKAVGLDWLPVVLGVLFMTIDLSEKIPPRWKSLADKVGFTRPLRRVAEIAFLVLAIFWAGYAAWDDEYEAIAKGEAEALAARGEARGLRSELAATASRPPIITPPAPIARAVRGRHALRRFGPPLVDGPLAPQDLPAVSFTMERKAGAPYLYASGSVVGNTMWRTTVSLPGAELAEYALRRPEDDQGMLYFDRTLLDQPTLIRVWVKPDDLDAFLKQPPKFLVTFTAGNGQSFRLQVPIQPINF